MILKICENQRDQREKTKNLPQIMQIIADYRRAPIEEESNPIF